MRAAPVALLASSRCGCSDARQAVQPGTAGELPTQLLGMLALIGEVVVVIVPPRRKTPPAPRAVLELTGVLVRVVVELIEAIPPPIASRLLFNVTTLLVIVSASLLPL